MNLYAALALLIAVAIAQTTVAPAFAGLGARPDFMLVVVVTWALLRGAGEGVVWGAIGGMALDVLSGSPFGVFAVSLAVVSFLTSLGEINVVRANVLLPGAAIVAATIIHHALILALLQLSGRPLTLVPELLWQAVPAASLNLICLTVLYRPLRWLHRRTSGQELPIGR